MKITVLGSSSSGNCYILEDQGHKLILDAGIHINDIKKELNYNFSDVVGCLVTHEHGDHFSAVQSLLYLGVNVYSGKKTFESKGIYNIRAHNVKALTTFEVAGFTVLPFDIQHDAAEPLGFLIITPSGKRILFVTDTWFVKYDFDYIDHFLIECNYDAASMKAAIDSGRIEPAVLKRVSKTHMSLEGLTTFLKTVDLSKAEKIVLCHLSDGNSHADYYKEFIEKEFGIPCVIADKNIIIKTLDDPGF